VAFYKHLRHQFHERRAELFIRLLQPAAGARLLDLGGSDGSLAARIVSRVPLSVTIADASLNNKDAVLARGYDHVLLDPDARLPFGARDFDYVLCNSVIEHVTLPKAECSVNARVPQNRWRTEARRAQKTFADQIRQMEASYFVQTPHRHFPVEAHVQLPFVQYLSHNGLCRLVKRTDRYWIKSCQGTVDWELLTPRDMRQLFPDATIHVESLAGLPKSIVAVRRSG
jgi:cyclopropane fatty-acyl-phospholipid synthase-like methyltransferase